MKSCVFMLTHSDLVAKVPLYIMLSLKFIKIGFLYPHLHNHSENNINVTILFHNSIRLSHDRTLFNFIWAFVIKLFVNIDQFEMWISKYNRNIWKWRRNVKLLVICQTNCIWFKNTWVLKLDGCSPEIKSVLLTY